MKIISTPDQLSTLGLPTKILAHLIDQLITLPFADVDAAYRFWQESDTSLVLAEYG